MEFVLISKIICSSSRCFPRCPQLETDVTNSISNSIQTCADRRAWDLTTKKKHRLENHPKPAKPVENMYNQPHVAVTSLSACTEWLRKLESASNSKGSFLSFGSSGPCLQRNSSHNLAPAKIWKWTTISATGMPLLFILLIGCNVAKARRGKVEVYVLTYDYSP